MRNIAVYKFSTTGIIPGIPGEWHAGQEVVIDLDTNTIIEVRQTPSHPFQAFPLEEVLLTQADQLPSKEEAIQKPLAKKEEKEANK